MQTIFPGDDKLMVRFYSTAVKNEAKSAAEGRPIYDDEDMCEIIAPADRQSKIVVPATAPWRNRVGLNGSEPITYAERFSAQWQRYKAGQMQTVSGTPLSELPFMTEGQRASLRALNVVTAEQLATLEGENLKNIGMGGAALKEQAKAYIQKARGGADVAQLAATNAELKAQIAELEKRVAAMPAPAAPAADAQTDPDALKAEIKALGGSWRGNPSAETLAGILAELRRQKAA